MGFIDLNMKVKNDRKISGQWYPNPADTGITVSLSKSAPL